MLAPSWELCQGRCPRSHHTLQAWPRGCAAGPQPGCRSTGAGTAQSKLPLLWKPPEACVWAQEDWTVDQPRAAPGRAFAHTLTVPSARARPPRGPQDHGPTGRLAPSSFPQSGDFHFPLPRLPGCRLGGGPEGSCQGLVPAGGPAASGLNRNHQEAHRLSSAPPSLGGQGSTSCCSGLEWPRLMGVQLCRGPSRT